MTVPTFVDTNILVYADDGASSTKRERAHQLIGEVVREGNGYISVQVLQEYFSAATRKLGLNAEIARQRVEAYSQMNVAILGPADVLIAIDLHLRYRLSIWDALIVRAALVSDCQRLYSEDLQAGFRIENLEIVNPFR